MNVMDITEIANYIFYDRGHDDYLYVSEVNWEKGRLYLTPSNSGANSQSHMTRISVRVALKFKVPITYVWPSSRYTWKHTVSVKGNHREKILPQEHKWYNGYPE
jgi:hypothetical protein